MAEPEAPITAAVKGQRSNSEMPDKFFRFLYVQDVGYLIVCINDQRSLLVLRPKDKNVDSGFIGASISSLLHDPCI